MADLKLAPDRERSVLPSVLLAAVVLAGAAAAVFYLNPRKTADLKVMEVQTFAPHTEMKALQTQQEVKGSFRVLNRPTSGNGEDDLYVVATVSVADKLRFPLYLSGVTAHVTFADGSEVVSRDLAVSDLHRLSAIFPDLPAITAMPIEDTDEVDPKTVRVGQVVFPFPGHTAEDWKKKREASLTLQLRNQEPQTTPLP